MSTNCPRLRMFAGPNGSGKSSLKRFLRTDLLGVYLNADEIEEKIRGCGNLNLHEFQVNAVEEEILAHFQRSEFLATKGFAGAAQRLEFSDNSLNFQSSGINSYFASVLVDFLRNKLLEHRMTFTFETVMSHPSKVQILAKAQSLGYRTYLYYVATEDPQINIAQRRALD